MHKKLNILMITNPAIEEFIEDKWIAESFIQDGHTVDTVNKFYDEIIEKNYDIFLKRNCWSTNKNDFVVGQNTDIFKQRIIQKNLPRINFDGKFDGNGKQYLVELYKKGYPVVPTIDNLNDISTLPHCETYLLKPHNGLDGFGIMSATKEQLKQHFNHNYVIQPKLDFISEVQFYFVGNKFEYVLEFSPSKVPVYPTPTLYVYTKEERKLAQMFADSSPNYNGVQRIDFLKTKQGLLLLEIEDSSPYLDLESVSPYKRKTFIRDYKRMVYAYYKTFKKDATN